MKELLKELKGTFKNVYKPGMDKKNIENTLEKRAIQLLLNKRQHDDEAPVIKVLFS